MGIKKIYYRWQILNPKATLPFAAPEVLIGACPVVCLYACVRVHVSDTSPLWKKH